MRVQVGNDLGAASLVSSMYLYLCGTDAHASEGLS